MSVERLAKGLTVLTFVTLCWVGHRSLQPRTECLNSSYLSLVLVDGVRIYNCKFESRLNLKSLFSPVPYTTLAKVRAIETLEPLQPFLPVKSPRIAIELLSEGDPQYFDMNKGYARIGSAFLSKPQELQRRLLMSVLNSEVPQAFSGPFELSVMTDFLTLILFPRSTWGYAPVESLKFSTASIENGFGPVLAVALAGVYQQSPLSQKLAAVRRLGSETVLPLIFEPLDKSGTALAHWFEKSLRELSHSLGLNEDEALRKTLKIMEVEAPTRWELTVDITSTPAWREILEQLKKRSQFRPKERILIFTPDGALALPSGLPVQWHAEDISSQKHVMIACDWPAPDQALQIHARHVFAEQSCSKLTRAFWD